MKSIIQRYGILLVAVGGIVGSVVAGPLSFDMSSLFSLDHADHEAFAGEYPLVLDHNYKLKDRSGDAQLSKASLEVFDASVVDPDQHCEFCTLLKYTPGQQQFAGIAYTTDSPLDLSKATRATVIVRGEEGGEKIQLGIAGKKLKSNGEVKYVVKTKQITLTTDWTPIHIDLTKALKKNLIDVTYPFEIQVVKSKAKSDIYFKYVTFDVKPAVKPVEAVISN
jgi:hypothetical protein